MAQYCNTTNPEPLVSVSSNAIIYFHSDSRDSYSGFQVAYSLLEGIDGCGGIYTGTVGEMGSPTMNNRYLPNMYCEYKISVPENLRIKITFLTFELEGGTQCYFDYVKVELYYFIASFLSNYSFSRFLKALRRHRLW